jgi:anthranilate synthase component 1
MRLGRFSVFHYISTIFFHCFLFYWLINHLCSPTLSSGSIKLNVGHFGSALQKSSMSCEEYKHAVVQAKEHILAGDIFQVVLSQRFERRTFADPFEIYRALRIVNPSPYMAYLQVT